MPCVGQDFANYHFLATGGSTRRTMPDRLSETVNVKDWGATGDGVANDTTAIQNAINYCLSTKPNGSKGGVVFFPPGSYALGTGQLTTGSNDPNLSLSLVGVNLYAVIITTNVAGPIISKGGGNTYDNLRLLEGFFLYNASSSTNAWSVQTTSTHLSILNCQWQSFNGIDTTSASNVSVRDCQAIGIESPDASAGGTSPFCKNSIGIALGTSCSAISCLFEQNWAIAFALSGNGPSITSCGAENASIACRIGWSPAGETAAIGASVQALQTEACLTHIELYNAQSCFVSGCFLSASIAQQPCPGTAGITSISWAAGIVTVQTTGNHNIGNVAGSATVPYASAQNGSKVLRLFDGAAAWSPGPYIYATVTDATHFTYPLTSDPGAATKPTLWMYANWYGIRVRKATECVIIATSNGAWNGLGSYDLDFGGNAAHRNNVLAISDIPYHGFLLPTNLYNLAGWSFIQAGSTTGLMRSGPPPSAVATPCAKLTFANLPGQFTPPGGGASFPDGPIPAQEFTITDGNTTTFNAVVSGGGGNVIKVRFDLSNWRVSG